MLNVMFKLTLSIIFGDIGAISTLKVLQYFISAEKVFNYITHSCLAHNCMYYFYFASFTTYGITCHPCSIMTMLAIGTQLIVFTWHAVYVKQGSFMTQPTSCS